MIEGIVFILHRFSMRSRVATLHSIFMIFVLLKSLFQDISNGVNYVLLSSISAEKDDYFCYLSSMCIYTSFVNNYGLILRTVAYGISAQTVDPGVENRYSEFPPKSPRSVFRYE